MQVQGPCLMFQVPTPSHEQNVVQMGSGSRVQVLRADRQKKLRHGRTPPGNHKDMTIQWAVHFEQLVVLFMAVVLYFAHDSELGLRT